MRVAQLPRWPPPSAHPSSQKPLLQQLCVFRTTIFDRSWLALLSERRALPSIPRRWGCPWAAIVFACPYRPMPVDNRLLAFRICARQRLAPRCSRLMETRQSKKVFHLPASMWPALGKSLVIREPPVLHQVASRLPAPCTLPPPPPGGGGGKLKEVVQSVVVSSTKQPRSRYWAGRGSSRGPSCLCRQRRALTCSLPWRLRKILRREETGLSCAPCFAASRLFSETFDSPPFRFRSSSTRAKIAQPSFSRQVPRSSSRLIGLRQDSRFSRNRSRATCFPGGCRCAPQNHSFAPPMAHRAGDVAESPPWAPAGPTHAAAEGDCYDCPKQRRPVLRR